ncbi:hypothetical protein GOV14_01430 [Candidatus Pacearchaeota archaeon]|nr:hypothetical protein [Candidatus Pacearchaeota archaeon]
MLKQRSSLEVEWQFHCDVCSGVVDNPICPECLAKSVSVWLTLYPNLKRVIYPKIESYLEQFEERITQATQCIKCQNKKAYVCPSCFIDFIVGQLKKVRIDSRILDEFQGLFDFDFVVPDPHAAKWKRYSTMIGEL